MVFSENVGDDDLIVLGPTSYELLGSLGFDVGIGFDHPFFYNPASGNLLLDFRIFLGCRKFSQSTTL